MAASNVTENLLQLLLQWMCISGKTKPCGLAIKVVKTDSKTKSNHYQLNREREIKAILENGRQVALMGFFCWVGKVVTGSSSGEGWLGYRKMNGLFSKREMPSSTKWNSGYQQCGNERLKTS